MTGASLMKPLTFAACAAVVAALAGCASSSSTNPLAEHTLHGTLTCQSVLVSGNTLANEVSTLFTDNQAISGQWANAEAEINTTPTAAQVSGHHRSARHAERPGHRNWSHGQPRPRCRFAGQQREEAHEHGASGWRSAGPAVSSDISTLNKTCAADVTGQSHVG